MNKQNKQNVNNKTPRNPQNNRQLVAVKPKLPRNMPPLPPVPQPKQNEKVVIHMAEPKKKKKKKSKGRSWWDLTGDILYHIGQKALAHGLAVLTGFGDYEVKSNSLLAAATEGKNGGSVPIMENSKVANIFRHREYVGDVLSSTSNFKAKQYVLNPGLDETFPWLSPIARNFTNYRMRGAMAEFVSLSSDYATNSTLGYVAFGTQYNSIDPIFTDKKTLENSEYANSCKPSECLAHPIECAPGQLTLSELYIRSGSLPTNADKRMCDLGVLTVATGGNPEDDVILGELWITYEIELYFPKLSQGANVNFFTSYMSNWTNATPLAGVILNGTPGTTMVMKQTTTGVNLFFPDDAIGQLFDVFIYWQGGSGTFSRPTLSGIDATITGELEAPLSGTSLIDRCMCRFRISIDKGKAGGFQFATSGGSLPTYNGQQGFLTICQIPN